MIHERHIPMLLRERQQWVLWKTIQRDKPTKVPFAIDGTPAKSNDPTTWTDFATVFAAYGRGGYDGIGYEFSKDDPFVGIDLDGCRDPETGALAEWARSIVLDFKTYAEVSPSLTGVKLFAAGRLLFKSGRKVELKDIERTCDKAPAIEIYDHGRYFAVTGMKLSGVAAEPQKCSFQIVSLCDQYWPAASAVADDFHAPQSVVERARKYCAKCPPAVSNQSGHNKTFHMACILVLGFSLDRSQALTVLSEWNQTCQPPWSERELEHKIDDAFKQPGPRGYLRNVSPQRWESVAVPHYAEPKQKPAKIITTISEAAQAYIERLRSGKATLVRTNLPELDEAIGGGVDFGEMVIIAARPSHGKSTVALQCAHNWTADGLPVLFVTEEMSAISLGKRALQFASNVPQENWWSELTDVEIDLHQFAGERSDCYIVENCGSAEVVAGEIEKAVKEKNIRAAIVDYAQLLSSPGKSRYEQITNTSIALRRVASEQKIVLLVLCQLNREIEARPKFEPKLSDLKDTGQLEQDADVIIFLVWPHRIDCKRDPHKYEFYIAKNRNREISRAVVECRFDPSRQMLTGKTIRDASNYEPAFSEYDPFDRP